MKENDLISLFNDDLSKILTHQPVVKENPLNDYAKSLAIAESLFSFSSLPLSHQQTTLKQTLLEKVTKQPQSVAPRPRLSFAITFGLCVLLAVFSLAIPTVRTFAQNVIQQIGNFFFINQPSDAENYVATMQSGTPTPTMEPLKPSSTYEPILEVGILSMADLNEKAGFKVYKIGYLPEGYKLMGRDVFSTSQSTTADSSYRKELNPPLQNGLQFSGIISLQQSLPNDNSEAWVSSIGDIPIVEVTVRGVKGVWIEQLPVYPIQNENGEWDYARWNQLIWSENGFTFMLQTNMPSDLLPLDEMEKIANSLEP